MDQKRPWVRIVVEGAVIVVSILLAFGIEASWAERQDREQARSLLSALLADFETAAVMLDTMEVYHQRLTDNGQILLEFGEVGDVPAEQRAGVDALLASHFLRPVYYPPMGTVEGLLASGRLDLFDNAALISGLTAWTGAVEGLQRTQLDAREHFYDRIYPYLASRIDLEDLDKGFAGYLGHPLPFQQDQTEAYRLLEDRELLNMLYAHWVLGINALEIQIPRVRKALDGIRAAIQHEVVSAGS